MQKAKKYSDNSENVTKKGKNTTLDENNATESNEENIKHYLYLNDDGEVDYLPGVEEMVKRYGKYKPGTNQLANDLKEIEQLAAESKWGPVHAKAEDIINNFEGKKGAAIDKEAALRSIYNRYDYFQLYGGALYYAEVFAI